MESGINELKEPEDTKQHSPVMQRLRASSPLSHHMGDYQKQMDLLDAANTSSFERRDQQLNGPPAGEARFPHQLSEFFATPSKVNEPPVTAFRSIFPRSQHGLSPLVDPFVAGKNHHLTNDITPMTQHPSKDRNRALGAGAASHGPSHSDAERRRRIERERKVLSNVHVPFDGKASPVARFAVERKTSLGTPQTQTHEDQLAAIKRLQEGNALRRTVLHDPLSANGANANSASRQQTANLPHGQTVQYPFHSASTTSVPSQTLTSISGSDSHYEYPMKQRNPQMPVYAPVNTMTNHQTPNPPQTTIRGTPPLFGRDFPPLSDDELRAVYPLNDSPTPMNVDDRNLLDLSEVQHAPYSRPLQLPPGLSNAVYPDASLEHDQKLDAWWHSGSHDIARQSDYASRLLSVNSGSCDSNGEAGAHLLYMVCEQLESYVKRRTAGAKQQKPDYFESRFAPPPAWCIADNADHFQSMFGEQEEGWGEAPARIARDPRYGAMGRPKDAADVTGFAAGRKARDWKGKGSPVVALPVLRQDRDVAIPSMGRFG